MLRRQQHEIGTLSSSLGVVLRWNLVCSSHQRTLSTSVCLYICCCLIYGGNYDNFILKHAWKVDFNKYKSFTCWRARFSAHNNCFSGIQFTVTGPVGWASGHSGGQKIVSSRYDLWHKLQCSSEWHRATLAGVNVFLFFRAQFLMMTVTITANTCEMEFGA
jgi:hypothetical protein